MNSTRRHSLLAAYPPEVTFEGVEFGPLYVMQVSIQNTSAKVQRVRVIPPSTEYFQLNYTPKGSVAPGLDITFEVEFQASQERDYHDSVHVTCGDETLEIPVHACVAAPKVEFSGLVNLGTVVKDNSVAKYVTFKNTGHRASKVTIELDDDVPININPKSFTLGAKGSFEDLDGDGRMEQDEFVNAADSVTSKRVRVEFTSSEIQQFHAIAKVSMTGGQPDRYLDINADVVDQRLELSFPDGGGTANAVPFGSIFYGETRVIKAFLVNNGPQTSGFNIKFPGYDDVLAEGGELDPNDDPFGLVNGDPEIVVEPLEGMIQPYAKLPITFTFKPRDPDADAGFRNNAFREGARKPRPYNVEAAIECPDTGQVLNVAIQGGAITAEVNVDETHVRFGECAVNDRVDVLVGIQNYGSELPCQFRISKAAHFSVRPASGRLMPGQSLDVVFSFRPAQMGKFSNTLQVVIGAGLLTIPVLVEGTSNSILKGARATATGTAHGALKSGTFSRAKPTFKFLSIQERLNNSKKHSKNSKFTRASAWDPSKTDVELFSMTSNPESTYSIEDMVRVSAHKDTYKDFIRTSYKKRTAAREIRNAKKFGRGYTLPATITVEDPGVDLGIAPRSGMTSPTPALPKMNDELYLKNPLDSTGRAKRTGGRHREEQFHDPDRLFKKKYKSKPTVQAEMRDCVLTLSSADLLCVSAGPKVIDFGRVTVKSTVVKSFSIINDLPANVLVEVDFDASELERSFPASQVVPGGANAGFDVVLCCQDVQTFRHTVAYKINGVHTLKFQVVAEVVPVTLDLAQDEVQFSFEADSLERSTTQHVVVSNPGNAPCDYRWASRRGAFEVFPTKGTIEAGDSTEISITFTPDVGVPTSEDIRLHIADGKSKSLKCVGNVLPTKCTFKSKELEFGTVSVGQRSQQRVVVKNVSANPAVFYASVADVAGASVSPDQGLIQPGKTTEFVVTLAPKQPHVYDSSINFLRLDIRGNKPMQLPVSGEAVIPKVAVEQDQFDFGQVAIGASAKLALSLVNAGEIPAHLIIDMTNHPDFSIERVMPTSSDGRPQTAQSVLVPVEDVESDEEVPAEPKLGSSRRGGAKKAAKKIEPPPKAEPQDGPIRVMKYRATVFRGAPLNLRFIFKPTGTAREHAFELPIALENVDETPTLRRAVLAEAMTPRIRLSSTHVDFGEVTISRDQVKRVPHHMTLVISNESEDILEWECDTDVIEQNGLGGIFELDPPSGRLEPESSTKVKISFIPEGPDTHGVVLPIYLDGNHERPYLELQLDGIGVYPRLRFDMEEFVLPPVPLGETAKGLFYVENQGYEDLELRFRLPADRTRMPVKLEFPEGKSVNLAKTRLPVVVSFSAQKPLAFTSRIDFLDEDENRYSIKVTGVSDNSIFTIHSFLANYSRDREYVVSGPGAPVMFALPNVDDAGDESASKADDGRSRGTATPRSPAKPKRTKTAQRRARQSKRAEKLSAKQRQKEKGPAATSWKTSDGETVYATFPDSGFTQHQEGYFVSWINKNLLPSHAQIANFPNDLPDKAPVIIELLEGYLRKPMRGKMIRVPKHKSELVAALIRQWKAVISALITCGALLHHVHPESFLPRDLYLRHFLTNGPGAVAPGDRTSVEAIQRSRMLEQRFNSVAGPAWTTLLFQIVKLFIVGRVNVKQYLSVPLVQPVEQHLLQAEKTATQQQRRGTGGTRASRKSANANPVEARLASLSELTGSNVQSISENLMLRWLNVLHESSQIEEHPRKAHSLRDLRDGILLCSVLRTYVPDLAGTNQPLTSINFGENTFDDAEDNEGAPRPRPPLAPELAEANVKKLCESLTQLDFAFVPEPEAILQAGEMEMLLLLTTIFNLLPQYYPKACIEFAGDLGQQVQKSLALRNPTRGTLAYSRTLSGDPNFKVSGASICIEPGSSTECELSFTSRFTRPARGRLELKSSKDDGLQRSILVFDLESKVLSRKPQETITAKTNLYAPQSITVTVTNPFERDCTFVVALEQPEAQEIVIPQRGRKQAPPPLVVRFPDSFSLQHSPKGKKGPNGAMLVSVAAGASTDVELFFVAFEQKRYVSELIFVDDNVGEFMYDVVVDVSAPQMEQEFKTQTPIRPSIQHDIKVESSCRLLNEAKEALLDHLQSAPNLLPARKEAVARFESVAAAPRQFQVDMSSPFFSGPRDLQLAPESDGGGADSESSDTLKLTLQPKEAGKYPCSVALRSPVETRVYSLQLEITSVGPDKVLEFVAPAKQTITQDIPIVNGTDKTWSMRAVLKGSPAFSGPTSFKIEPRSTGHYKLIFQPTWLGSEEASLVISCAEAKCSFSYTLIGKGEEPLAVDHIELECMARETVVHSFGLPQNASNRAITYQVESDLPHISGESTVVAPPSSEKTYDLAITPQVGGTYSGTVTFRDAATGQFFWFTVDVHASSPEPEDELEIAAETRKAVSVEISLGNPLQEAVTFEVSLRGEGLIGDQSFTLAAGDGDATYELIYSPLVAGNFSGSITFTNDQLGEFWYKLVLKATQAPPTQLPPMSCAVGSSCTQEITLDNPTDSSLNLVSHASNMTNYRVEPARVSIPAYGSQVVLLRYIPSSIGIAENCVVTFSNRRIGKLVYNASGSGEVPGTSESRTVFSALHQGKSESFNFRNPFDDVLPITMKLVLADTPDAEGGESVSSAAGEFRLLVRQSEVELAPFAQLHVPFLFIPRVIGKCEAALVVEGRSPDSSLGVLTWRFPIVGITEVTVTDVMLSFSCRARETVSETLALPVPGFDTIPGLDPEGESEFDFELVPPEDPVAAAKLDKALDMQLVKNVLSNAPRSSDSTPSLEFSVLLQPLVMFTETVELIVTKKTGGVWRYHMKLDVTEPEVDDKITIEAKLHHTSSVSFELNNIEPESTPFKAFFTADSPLEFNVFPASGDLAPYGSAEGTTFIVSFTPQDYGKTAVGKLYIQTEDMMWSYEVKGAHPAYAKPSLETSTSKIDSGLSRSQLRSLSNSRRK